MAQLSRLDGGAGSYLGSAVWGDCDRDCLADHDGRLMDRDPTGWHAWFWLAVLIALSVAASQGVLAQVPVTVVACDQAHDRCEYSTAAVTDSQLQACLDINAQGSTVADECVEGQAYPACWSYGVGNHDFCATLPNSPASASDPCYEGCFTSSGTACGRSIDLPCRTCRLAWGPSTPRCRICDQVVEVCFNEILPTDPADPNYPGEGSYNPDDPADPDDFGDPEADPSFAGCAADQRCDCDGDGVDEPAGTTCNGDRNDDGDADEGDIVQKVCDDMGRCSCPNGTNTVNFGGGSACQVTDECQYHSALWGQSENCGCGRLLLYEGRCVAGCPDGSTLSGSQCVPDDDEVTDPLPFEGTFSIGGLCEVDFGVEDDDYLAFVQTAWDGGPSPLCRRWVTSILRVFSPVYAASGGCPFQFSFALTAGGESYPVSSGDAACTVMENHRAIVQAVLGWIYLMMSVRLFVRII